MVFVQKLTIFPCFFLLVNLGKENVFYDILDQKNFFLRYKNKKLKKSKNKDFSKTVSPWFFFKTGHFLLVNLGKENVFSILDRKNALLGYKNKKSKKSKNWDFYKGVSPWFLSKMCNFSIYSLLVNLAKENVFYDILSKQNRWKNGQFWRKTMD